MLETYSNHAMPELIFKINMPEEAYQNALSFSPAERERMIINAFVEDLYEEPDYDRETNEADLEAIGRGLEDEKAGRVSSGYDVLAQLEKRFGA